MCVFACVCVCVRSWKPWDTFKERPEIHDGPTPWKYIKILSFLLCCLCGLVVFALALCSKVLHHPSPLASTPSSIPST